MRSVSLSALLVLALLLASLPASRAEAATCQFVLGFKTLHDLIPQIVGDCLENEHHNAVNGDGLQQTTGVNNAIGLLVWRKADNWTAYTDGYRTWVNGPFGLTQRLNSQRFSWEQNPDHLAMVPTPVAGDRCHTAGLSVAEGAGNGGAGHVFVPFTFTNNLTVSCTFFGFPGLGMLDAQNNGLPTTTVRDGDGATLLTVPAGGSATFWISYVHLDFAACYDPTQMAITPPDEFDPLIIPFSGHVCIDGNISVKAVGVPG